MERFGVVSDIHANLEALEAVLERLRGLEIVCLGDLVDYGAEPNEVIARLRESGARSILGNHDAAALSGDSSLFNPKAAMSSAWTRARLSEESRAYLLGLKDEMRLTLGGVDFYMTHGSPDDHLWEYVDPRTDSDLFGYYLDRVGAKVIGLGHTHTPFVWEEEGRVVFNPGSVGQPRDGDWRASCAVVTVGEGAPRVDVARVGYDVEAAAEKILHAGLPASHATRLSAGV